MLIGFTEENTLKVAEILSKYPIERKKSAVMPLLDLAQRQNDNYLSRDAIEYIAKILEMAEIRVYEVATFYSMFNLKPVGKHVFEVCHTGPCMLNGSDKILEYIKKKLAIGVGETTPDGMFTLKTVECLGACGYAPMMQLGLHYREHLTEAKVDAIIDECRNKK